MKTRKNLNGGSGGSLRTECYDAYANYFVKYIKEYEKKNTNVFAITVQNEPLYAPEKYPGMLMSSQEQINFIKNHLGPKFKSNDIQTKIIGYDHNYDKSGFDYALDLLNNAGSYQYISGIGFHTYASPNHQAMSTLHYLFPNKGFWITEAGNHYYFYRFDNNFS